jgi:hypothetical protein
MNPVPGRRNCPSPWIAASAALLGGLLLPVRQGAAQVQSRGTNQGVVDFTVAGTITSSIAIYVTGSTDLQGGVSTVVTGTGVQGVVNFGTYNIAGLPLTGDKQAVNNGNGGPGNYLIATLTVQTRFSGGGSMLAAVDIQRTNPCGAAPDIACGAPGRLFFAKQIPRKPNQKATWPTWKKYPDARYGASVLDMPLSTYVPGAGNLDNQMANGDSLDHQVSIWIPNSTPPGPFSTMVTYTATRL